MSEQNFQGNQIIKNINNTMDLNIHHANTLDELKHLLALHIEKMLLNDVEKLFNILYRIDIEETEVKNNLYHNPPDIASQLLAESIIERQLQKIDSRKSNRS